MALDRHNILTVQDPVDLAPLANSHEADESERELKLLFKAMLDAYVRLAEQNTRTLGMPQVGSNDQFERAVKQDGIALYRREDLASTEAMRYVYAAWRAGNPKRGLGMLKAYMQLQWPNAWDCVQMWQSKSRAYPNGLIEADDGNAFLTSRVDISLSADGLGSANINQIGPALRSVIPARMMLSIASKSLYSAELFTAAAATGLEVQYFEGVATSIETVAAAPVSAYILDALDFANPGTSGTAASYTIAGATIVGGDLVGTSPGDFTPNNWTGTASGSFNTAAGFDLSFTAYRNAPVTDFKSYLRVAIAVDGLSVIANIQILRDTTERFMALIAPGVDPVIVLPTSIFDTVGVAESFTISVRPSGTTLTYHGAGGAVSTVDAVANTLPSISSSASVSLNSFGTESYGDFVFTVTSMRLSVAGALDPLWPDVLLLLRGDGPASGTAVIDSSPYARTATGSGVSTETSVPGFYGDSQLRIDGTEYREWAGLRLTGYSTWTIEGFLTLADYGSPRSHLFGSWAPEQGWTFDIEATTGSPFLAINGSGATSTGSVTIATGVRTHIALVLTTTASNTTGTLYVNGVARQTYVGPAAGWSAGVGSDVYKFRLGNRSDGTLNQNSSWDEFRVTSGARYVGPFTPPAGPHPAG